MLVSYYLRSPEILQDMPWLNVTEITCIVAESLQRAKHAAALGLMKITAWLSSSWGAFSDRRQRAVGLAVGVWLAAALPAAQAGETLDRVLAAKTLILAVDEQYPPFSTRDYDGEMTGFDIDIAREIAARLGVTLKVVTPGWNRIVGGHWQGQWDIAMGAIEPTAERGAVLEFAAMYADAPAVILVHNGASMAGAADLKGKRIGVEAGSVYEAYLRGESATPDSALSGVDIIAYEVEPFGIDDLAHAPDSAIDAMIVSLLTAQDAIGIGKPVTVASAPLFRRPFVIAADKGDPEFAARLAEVVEAMRADGTLSRLSVQHLGVDAAPPAP
jgi:polar amino acid transport system substrate-binding protein